MSQLGFSMSSPENSPEGSNSSSDSNYPEKERRRFPRVNYRTVAELKNHDGHSTGESFEAEVLDLSCKGALVILFTPQDTLTVGTKISLKIDLTSDGPTIQMMGSIAHKKKYYYGIHCDSIDDESREHLRKILLLDSNDEAIADRDLDNLIEPDGDFSIDID